MEPKRNGGRFFGWIRGFRDAPSRARAQRPVPSAKQPLETGAQGWADWLILGVGVLVLVAVAGGAGYVSYHHFYGLAVALGEPHDMAMLYPAMSDGVIIMASLVLVYCSRRGIPVPLGVWAALMLGCVVTLVANVAHGWSGGLGSRLLSALAPVAFVGAYELLMWLVRIARRSAANATSESTEVPLVEHVCQPETVTETITVTETVTVRVVPTDRYEAARLAYEESLEPGNRRMGWRPLANRWGIEVAEAKEIIAEVDRERTPAAPPEVPAAAPEVPAVPATPDVPDEAQRAFDLVRKFTKDNPPTEAELNAAGLSERGKDILRKVWNMPDPQQPAVEGDDFLGELGERAVDREEFLRTGALVPPAEPTDEELFAGMTPAEALSGPGATELRRQWRERAAVNGSKPSS